MSGYFWLYLAGMPLGLIAGLIINHAMDRHHNKEMKRMREEQIIREGITVREEVEPDLGMEDWDNGRGA